MSPTMTVQLHRVFKTAYTTLLQRQTVNNCKRTTHDSAMTGCHAKDLKMEMVFHFVNLIMFIKIIPLVLILTESMACVSMFLLSIWSPSTKTMDVIGQR